ncbi:HCL308Cp [Eremothecium sinecaudum]|uniref:Pre-mRNA-splicing factor SYF2 n=1 Tax=Eremothecium sinecaudum TaxID=45286 RepID=A0A109UYF8_9SACH|nr:HCL308Cp [Eremothecium sinecaudum]AMD19843.1 HCL308Cp [Eremothecium sinecaudum]
MGLEEIQERLKKLKKERVKLSIANRKEIVKEEKLKSSDGKPQVYSMDYQPEGSKDIEDETHSSRLLNYNISEYEKWEAKEKSKRKFMDGADASDVAYLTYNNGLKQLQKSERLPKGKVTKGMISQSGKLLLKDDKDLVDNLADTLENSSRERYLKRKKKMESKAGKSTVLDQAINEKNKQFNDKLASQFKKLDS